MATDITPENVARAFHEAYERLAPAFGYETRLETRAFDPLSPNGQLMISVAREALPSLSARLAEVEADCAGYQQMLMAEANSSLERLARAEAAEAENAKLLEALTLVLPLAKGYATANRHDINRRVVEIAEAALQVKP